MNIAIVEDDNAAAAVISGFIDRYAKENGADLVKTRYPNADSFLADSDKLYAVVLFDVKMPGTSGMDAAFELRKRDKSASVLFITSMTQLAQKGYEVDAVGYLVKPVKYFDFALKFKKAISVYTSQRTPQRHDNRARRNVPRVHGQADVCGDRQSQTALSPRRRRHRDERIAFKGGRGACGVRTIAL